MSCVYCEPKSRMRTVSRLVTAAVLPPDRAARDVEQRRLFVAAARVVDDRPDESRGENGCSRKEGDVADDELRVNRVYLAGRTVGRAVYGAAGLEVALFAKANAPDRRAYAPGDG